MTEEECRNELTKILRETGLERLPFQDPGVWTYVPTLDEEGNDIGGYYEVWADGHKYLIDPPTFEDEGE